MAAQRPYTLVAELTYRCPLKCLYCSNPIEFHAMREELTTRQWCQTFTEAADLGVVQVHLSGGEPLVRNDLPELIRHARECDLYTNLITSGTLLNEDKLREFRACGLEHIQLSMQDTDREQAEIVAGIKSYDKKLEVAQLITQLGYPLTINVVLHNLNIDRVPELITQAAELGAQRIELANTQYYAWAFENRRALLPSFEKYEQAEAIARAARKKYEGKMEIAFVKIDYYEEAPKACSGGWARNYMCITPTGEVLPCHAAHAIEGITFESVKNQSLVEIWQDSPGLNAFRGYDWMQEPCRSCPRKEQDFGGCRCQAFLLTGDAAATDPVCKLSPQHDVVLQAAAQPRVENPVLVYRDMKNSQRLSVPS